MWNKINHLYHISQKKCSTFYQDNSSQKKFKILKMQNGRIYIFYLSNIFSSLYIDGFLAVHI